APGVPGERQRPRLVGQDEQRRDQRHGGRGHLQPEGRITHPGRGTGKQNGGGRGRGPDEPGDLGTPPQPVIAGGLVFGHCPASRTPPFTASSSMRGPPPFSLPSRRRRFRTDSSRARLSRLMPPLTTLATTWARVSLGITTDTPPFTVFARTPSRTAVTWRSMPPFVVDASTRPASPAPSTPPLTVAAVTSPTTRSRSMAPLVVRTATDMPSGTVTS